MTPEENLKLARLLAVIFAAFFVVFFGIPIIAIEAHYWLPAAWWPK